MEFLRWLEKEPLGAWVRESEWGYPIVLCAHAVGMAIVVGCVLMVNARVLGYGRSIAIAQLRGLSWVAWSGFAVNAVSGLLLYFGNARRLTETAAFQVKILLLVIGGAMVWLLWRTLRSEAGALEPNASSSNRLKLIAAASTLTWIGVILAGRTIGYTINFEPLP
jgi:hypothetical protein